MSRTPLDGPHLTPHNKIIIIIIELFFFANILFCIRIDYCNYYLWSDVRTNCVYWGGIARQNRCGLGANNIILYCTYDDLSDKIKNIFF